MYGYYSQGIASLSRIIFKIYVEMLKAKYMLLSYRAKFFIISRVLKCSTIKYGEMLLLPLFTYE